MADFVSSGTENHNSISQFNLFLRHSLYFYHFCRRFFSLFLVTAPCCGMAGVTYLRTAVEFVAAVRTISLSVADAVNVGARLVSQARELTDVARCRRQQQHNNNNNNYNYYYTRLMAYSGHCCSIVECSSVVCSFCAIAAAVPPRPQDGTACFSHRTLHHSVQLCDRL